MLLSFLEVWSTEIGGGLRRDPLTEKLFPPSADSSGPPIIVKKIVKPSVDQPKRRKILLG